VKTHVLLIRANPEGAVRLLYGGAAGALEQRKVIEEFGGKVRAQYVVTGDYDLVLIADLPSDAALLAISLGAEAGGLYVDSLRAYSDDEIGEAQAFFPEISEWENLAGSTDKEA
jgi:uncharacterized protein with GYD domain